MDGSVRLLHSNHTPGLVFAQGERLMASQHAQPNTCEIGVVFPRRARTPLLKTVFRRKQLSARSNVCLHVTAQPGWLSLVGGNFVAKIIKTDSS